MEQKIPYESNECPARNTSWEAVCERRLRRAYNQYGHQRFMSALSRVMRDAGLLDQDNGTKTS